MLNREPKGISKDRWWLNPYKPNYLYRLNTNPTILFHWKIIFFTKMQSRLLHFWRSGSKVLKSEILNSNEITSNWMKYLYHFSITIKINKTWLFTLKSKWPCVKIFRLFPSITTLLLDPQSPNFRNIIFDCQRCSVC